MKVPGFVDLQVNGFKGVDFSSGELTEEKFAQGCGQILENGTSAFLATVITSPVEVYKQNLGIIADVIERDEFKGQLLGVHLEGPFISPEPGARGIHPLECVRKPDIGLLEQMIDWSKDNVKLLTIAAEIEGAEELARYAIGRGITVSLGHHNANEEDLEKLAQAGATSLTHLGNGVPMNLNRHNNPVMAGMANDELAATMIADGHHLPPTVLKNIIRAKEVSRCIVISDASPVAGMAPGRYNSFGGNVVLEEDGRLYNADSGYLAGSSATMLECMNYLASLRLLSDEQLLDVGFFNPLKLIDVKADSIRHVKEIQFDNQKKLFTLC